MIHGPSFKAGLQAAANYLREEHFGGLAPAVLKLKPPKPSAKKSAARRARTATKRQTRTERNAETAAIRRAVFERATPSYLTVAVCELCRKAEATDLHHGFGRVKVAQAADNCLACCRRCHEEVTNPKGAADAWRRVSFAFSRLGLHGSAARALGEAAWCEAKSQARNTQEGR